MANQGRPSYRLNLNRNPTRKWAEAQQVDYGGDDWGDEDYDDYSRPEPEPVSAGPQRHPGWGQGGGQVSQRSFTNPSLPMGTGGSSFDRTDDRRHVSAGGYNPRYDVQSSSTLIPHPETSEQHMRNYANQASLHVDTRTPSHVAHGTEFSQLQDTRHNDQYGVPYSAPVGTHPPHFQSHMHAPRSDDFETTSTHGRHGDDMGTSDTFSVPRKSSLSQQHNSSDTTETNRQNTAVPSQVYSDPSASKPLPFIRPADIYKRMPEELEKERRSQESSRPSVDSGRSKTAGSPTRVEKQATSTHSDNLHGDKGPPRKLHTTLDSVAERKSEYGLSPVNAGSMFSPNASSITKPATEAETSSTLHESGRPIMVSRTASSVYTDIAAPASAGSAGSAAPNSGAVLSRTPIADSPQQQTFTHSPSTNKLSGLGASDSTTLPSGDLPDFDRGVSQDQPIASTRVIASKPEESLREETDPAARHSTNHQRQPSHGYKSAVQHAFNPENHSSFSSTTADNTLPRSESNATSDNSPMIGRRAGETPENSSISRVLDKPASGPTAAAPSFSQQLPQLAMTNRETRPADDVTTLPATTFTPEFRGEHHHLGTEESKARRPLSVEIPSTAVPQEGVLSTVTAPSTSTSESTVDRLPSNSYNRAHNESNNSRQISSLNELVPPPTSRTASEDWHDWQAQRRQFHATHGIQDSNTASPALSNPASRAESPTKGTVRDIAGRIESNSGRSSPVANNSATTQGNASNKPPHTRNESFRPALPGGWLSYTTTESGRDSPDASAKYSQYPLLQDKRSIESTESIPTAVAPKQWRASHQGPIDTAFAAAAAAGNAMAGAFSGPALSKKSRQYSDTDSDEDDTSSVSQSHAPDFSETRDFAEPHAHRSVPHPPPQVPVAESSPTTQQVPLAGNQEQSAKANDFPAPLRTSRVFGDKQSSPRLSIAPVVHADKDQDPEQLQRDIVQSLTPKTSNVSETPAHFTQPSTKSLEPTPISVRPVSTTSDDVLPHEYSSYWDDDRTPTHAQHTGLPATVPSVPKTTLETNDLPQESRPMLEERYSWETDKGRKIPEATKVGVAKGEAENRPSTPTHVTIHTSNTASPQTPIVHRSEHESLNNPSTENMSTPSTVGKKQAGSFFPQPKADFKSILSFKDPLQRIRAFDESRQTYAESNNPLEEWLLSMNTSEHSDVLQANRIPRVQSSVPQQENRPSPRREATGTSGTKQMQEDGKRLLAAAGKYGGKAGIAAKGLFAKGKDRLRTASSSDKDFPTHRRRSSSFGTSTRTAPRSEEPVLSERAPQIPTPALATPIGEPGWGALSTKIDQMFSQNANQTNTTSSNIGVAAPTQHAPATSNTSGQSNLRNDVLTTNNNIHPAAGTASLPGSLSQTTKPPRSPGYGMGTEATSTTTETTAPKGTERYSTTNTSALSKVSTEHDRPVGRERVDSLSVPRQRRQSSVSDVSDISAPHDGPSDSLPRNVSPALEHQSRGQVVPIILGHPRTKEEEAGLNKNRVSQTGNTLPAYSAVDERQTTDTKPRVAPGAHIVPVAEMKSLEPEANRHADSRPFSFFGSETLNHAMSQQAAGTPQPGTVERTSTDESSRGVDLEKHQQPNITEHPAYRASSHDQMTTEASNPLPSSRRAPQEFEQTRQRQQIGIPQRDEREDGYRIPGPYGQEYRSPRSSKPISNPGSVPNLHKTSETSPDITQAAQSWAPGDTARAGLTDVPSQIEHRPESERSKSRSFGGFFRTRSRSQNRRQVQETSHGSTPSSEYVGDEGRRKKGFFSIGNRQTSPVRPTGDGRGDTMGYDSSRGRKLSIDMLKSSAFGAKSPTDPKKKRTSGFGAFFSKPGNREKGTHPHERSASAMSLRGPQQQYSAYDQKPNQMQHPNTYNDHQQDPRNVGQTAYSQQSYPTGPSNAQHVMPHTAYQETSGNHAPGEQLLDQHQGQGNQWQPEPDRPQIYDNAPYGGIVAVPGPSIAQKSGFNPTPATSMTNPVISTHTNRDIGYGQERPYVPPTLPRDGRGTSPAGNKIHMADHVKNLHKRSRSPRLGRPPSDEHLQAGSLEAGGSGAPRQSLASDPASQLGVFNSKKMSPSGGVPRSEHEQEKPWTIGIPHVDDDNSDGEGVTGKRQSEIQQPVQRHVDPSSSATVSPATPHQHGQQHGVADIVSPMTAVEPKHQRFDTAAAPHHERNNVATRQYHAEDQVVPEQMTAPPSISNAAQILVPHPQTVHPPNTAANKVDSANATLPTSQAPPSPRDSKQAAIERVPNSHQSANTASSRPLTVAEKVMGVQPAARGTVPEHRSTTPVLHSPAPSIGAVPKSTIGPDQAPNATTMSTTKTSGTHVTTTTMRTGSKLGRGNVQTSTYVIDSNVPSKNGPNVNSNSNRNLTGEVLTSTPTATAPPVPAPATSSAAAPMSTSGNSNLRVVTGSKGLNNKTHRTPAGKSFDAVELPGSRPDGYESEEEVVMSATAYPGQEWIPEFAQGVSWDDSDERL